MNTDQEQAQARNAPGRNIAIGFIVGMMLGGLVDSFTGDLGIGTISGMVLGSLLGYYGLHRIHWMEYQRGDLLKVAMAGVFFFLTFLGVYYLLKNGTSQWLRNILPLAPIIPGLLMIVTLGQALSHLDELQRRIQVEAIAIGFGITAIIVLTYGLFGLTGMPQPNWILVPVIMTFSWLLGKVWTRWKYR